MSKQERREEERVFAEATDKGKEIGLMAADLIRSSYDVPYIRRFVANAAYHEMRMSLFFSEQKEDES